MRIVLTADTLTAIAREWVKKRLVIDDDAITDITECGINEDGTAIGYSFAQVEVTVDDEKLQTNLAPIAPPTDK